ncbi:glycerophosphodiester phosphodiesterase [Salipaludibacillus sp. HK11]|uniref:glycerophosphodiester phosphodiesterase n=1 Tax=Salipaludibacillus sp. HK11 TaxID=3394320 RepID=UPI0039FD5528
MNNFVAHRGWSAKAPENTLSAFEMAAEHSNVSMIELDVQITKDGELIVIHDFTLDRTTSGTGYVGEKTLAEIQSLKIKETFEGQVFDECVPTLKEVFSLLRSKINLNIEIKKAGSMYPTIEETLTELIAEYNMQDQVRISSFNHQSIQKIHLLNPDLNKGLIVYGQPVLLKEQLKATGSKFLSIHYSFLTKALVKEMRKNDIQIGVWTVDDLLVMEKISNIDPNITICTNDLDVASKLVNS